MRLEIDELRPVTAGRLLAIWQARREDGGDGLERSMLCNARVLAECCYCHGAAVFPDERAVLSALTARQMERLLRCLAGEDGSRPEAENPVFDQARYDALREG